MVYVRSCDVEFAVAEVGMKPEKNAFVLLDMMFWMGTHGLSKVDWTTEWFCAKLDGVFSSTTVERTFGWNWNWIMSPAFAFTLLG